MPCFGEAFFGALVKGLADLDSGSEASLAEARAQNDATLSVNNMRLWEKTTPTETLSNSPAFV